MGSKKRSSWSKQKSEFLSGLGGMDDVFAAEGKRRAQASRQREASKRDKACSSKNRYASRSEAEATIAECQAHGAPRLESYKCPYCNGWHLTSHPWD